MVDGNWIPLNTTLLPEDSEAFIKNKDFEEINQQIFEVDSLLMRIEMELDSLYESD